MRSDVAGGQLGAHATSGVIPTFGARANGSDDFVRIDTPDEGARLLVVLLDED
jgi:hypothetical protein